MKALIVAIFLICTTAASSEGYLEKYNQIVKSIDSAKENTIKSNAIEYLNLFLSETNSGTLIKLQEKKNYYNKTQHQVALNNSIKGFLGAYFNNNKKKEPYAYAFILAHSKEKVLKDFIKNNEISKKIKNIEIGNYTNIYFSNSPIYFKKIAPNKYLTNINYYIDSYNNFKKNQSYSARSYIQIEIDESKPYFYFYITKLSTNFNPN